MRDINGRYTHPVEMPNFNVEDHPVWYMAHPVAPDERYSFQQNMDHIIKCMRMCYDAGVRVVAPYYGICHALDDSNIEHRRIGLEVDLAIVKKLNRLILTGHKLSTGMQAELKQISISGLCINMTYIPDSDFVRILHQTLAQAETLAGGISNG